MQTEDREFLPEVGDAVYVLYGPHCVGYEGEEGVITEITGFPGVDNQEDHVYHIKLDEKDVTLFLDKDEFDLYEDVLGESEGVVIEHTEGCIVDDESPAAESLGEWLKCGKCSSYYVPADPNRTCKCGTSSVKDTSTSQGTTTVTTQGQPTTSRLCKACNHMVYNDSNICCSKTCDCQCSAHKPSDRPPLICEACNHERWTTNSRCKPPDCRCICTNYQITKCPSCKHPWDLPGQLCKEKDCKCSCSKVWDSLKIGSSSSSYISYSTGPAWDESKPANPVIIAQDKYVI